MPDNDMMQRLLDSHRRLGLRLTSSDQEVKSAYRKLAFELHPDRKGVSPHAGEAAFKLVQQDYETIRRFRDVHRASEQAAAAAQQNQSSWSRAAGFGAQKAAGQAAKPTAFRFGAKSIVGTLSVGALLVGAGFLIETVKYKYVKPQIENSKLARRMSGIAGPYANMIVAAPIESHAASSRAP